MKLHPLPKRPLPKKDELLSSWIVRLAQANYCSVEEMCGYLGIVSGKPPETEADLNGIAIERFYTLIGLTPDIISGMVLERRKAFPVECIAWSDFQRCLECTRKTPGLVLRHWRYAWSLSCNTCGSSLEPMRTNDSNKPTISSRLQQRALNGAKFLEHIYYKGNRHASRRVEFTLEVIRILFPYLQHGLATGNLLNRYKMLAAIEMSKARPLLALALTIRCHPGQSDRLWQAFPHQRKAIAKVFRLADYFYKSLPSDVVKSTSEIKRPKKIASKLPTVYQRHAQVAIDMLGPDVCKHELLTFAMRSLEQEKTGASKN